MTAQGTILGKPDSVGLNPGKYYPHLDIEVSVGRYTFAGKSVRNKVCLDVACGSGYGSDLLRRSDASMVIGADIAEDRIRVAREYYTHRALHFTRANAQHLPFRDESFDVLVTMETIEHLRNPEQFINECRRVLKPEGMLICSTPNQEIHDSPSQTEQTPLNPFGTSRDHIQEYSAEELCSFFSEDKWKEVTLYGQQFVRKDFLWRIKVLVTWLTWRCVLLLPKGTRILDFLNRLRRKRHLRLTDLDASEVRSVEAEIRPLRPRSYPGEPRTLVVTAKR